MRDKLDFHVTYLQSALTGAIVAVGLSYALASHVWYETSQQREFPTW